ncbi:MAG: hypothetical protein SGCHY_005235, partial [Lobulomycetales sp.]
MRRFVLGSTNFLSSLFLAWTGRLLFQRSFEHIKLRQRDRNTQLPPGPSLWRKIRSLIAREYAVLALFNLVSIACTLMANFYLLRRFITVGLSFSSFISSRIQDTSYLNGFYIFITCVTGQICWHHVIQAASAIGSHSSSRGFALSDLQKVIKACLDRLVLFESNPSVTPFRHTRPSRAQLDNIEDVVNLISNDANQIGESFIYLHFLWAAPLEAICIVALGIVDVGWKSGIASSFLILFGFLPLQFMFAFYVSKISYESTLMATRRVHLMAEIMTTIK